MKEGVIVIKTAADAVALIRKEKRQQGIKWLDLADTAGISPNTINNWVCGERMPHLETALMVLDALGISLVAMPRKKDG